MILTPDFVYIHYPKTGGTFVTDVLSRVYGGAAGGCVDTDKHAGCSEIPPGHQGKPIVSTVRNVFERYVSQYCFGWWKLHPEDYCGAEEMRDLFPHYPDLTFGEFVQLANARFLNCHQGRPTGFVNRRFPPGRELGWHSEQFVRFYLRRPQEAFGRLDEDSLARRTFLADLYPVHFLPFEDLNGGLYEWLRQIGHPPEAIEFIKTAAKVFPAEGGRPPEDRWQSYYTPEVRDFIRTRERLLFEVFPQHGSADVEVA
jgi:hypothetical protein